MFCSRNAKVNLSLARARILAELIHLCSEHADVTPGALRERCCATSSEHKLIAGVSKQNHNNRSFLLCLFPETRFHSLRCMHTHFHCRMNRITGTDEIQQVA